MAIAMSRPARSTIASAQRTASLERKGKAVSVVVVRVSSTNAVSVERNDQARQRTVERCAERMPNLSQLRKCANVAASVPRDRPLQRAAERRHDATSQDRAGDPEREGRALALSAVVHLRHVPIYRRAACPQRISLPPL